MDPAVDLAVDPAVNPAVRAQAAEWLRLDQDPETRREIEGLVARGVEGEAELWELVGERLTFGTAGLRARMQAGFSRMNALTVIQASQGLGAYVLAAVPGAAARGAVVGHDSRHRSQRFAELTAAALMAVGFKRVVLYDGLVHTPLVPFGVTRLGAAVGVMVTASHNPKEDNGYKVYNEDGCQINTPVDQTIAASILRHLEPLTWDTSTVTKHPLADIEHRYYAEVARLLIFPLRLSTLPRFAYTPLHGVGHHFMAHALHHALARHATHAAADAATALSRHMYTVATQQTPDPTFPTVRLPNPEEAGALDAALALADTHGLPLVLAHDPDADRFAAAEKVGPAWHVYSGDQLGALLGYHAWTTAPAATPHPTMYTSAVSSGMLVAMGAAEGFAVRECLTGFKWLGAAARADGPAALFGYEEALGYMAPRVGCDKDGVSAALLFLELCAVHGSPWRLLQSLYARFGAFATLNTYWRARDAAVTERVFAHVAAYGPARVAAGVRGFRYRDLGSGVDSGTADGKAVLPGSPGAMMVTFWFGDGGGAERGVRCTIRASGTEPKIKVYIECHGRDGLEAARAAAARVLLFVRATWFMGEGLVMDEKYAAEVEGVGMGGGESESASEAFWG